MRKKRCFQSIICTVLFALILSCVVGARLLIPGGNTIGMKAYAQGLVVTKVDAGSPAARAGLQAGDILTAASGNPLADTEQLLSLLAEGAPVEISYQRGGKARTATVTPEQTDSELRIGAHVRDCVAGIGTVTYYDPESGSFGALGHGVSEPSGEGLLPIAGGVVVPSSVTGVIKSDAGAAGQLKGEFEAQRTIGRIEANTPVGVFGKMQAPDAAPIETAAPEEVQIGKAKIYANVDGTAVEPYEIEIVRSYGSSERGRELLLRVTDPQLLAETGGIVQGMSGSPIVQNGKLVGAVTHVLVNQPDMGYGVFIDTMLRADSRIPRAA